MNLQKVQKFLFFIAAPLILMNVFSGLFLNLGDYFDFIHPQMVSSEISPYPTYISLAETGLYIGRPFNKIEKITLKPKDASLAVYLDDSEVVYVHPRSGVVLKRGRSWLDWPAKIQSLDFFQNKIIQLTLNILTAFVILSYLIISAYLQRTSRP